MERRKETPRPMGVIGCLRTGFEMVGRNLWLIGFPVLLDLFLWLGPRLSVYSLVEGFVAFIRAQPAPDLTTTRQVEQAAQLLEQIGERFNLLSLFSTLPLLNVPSLLARHAPGALSPLGEPRVLRIPGVLALIGWGTVMAPIGLLLGFLYLSSVAERVRAMRLSDEQEGAPSKTKETELVVGASSGIWKLIRIFLFAGGFLAAGVVLAPLWALLVGTTLTIAPLLGFLVWAFSMGLGSYIALHLLFVVHGLTLGERGLLQATWESITLIHTQFPSVVGLAALAIIINQGLSYVWSLPPADSWSLLVGIVGNGCIATGLTAATFVFYQERIGLLMKMSQISTST
jgi:hypothetical protein